MKQGYVSGLLACAMVLVLQGCGQDKPAVAVPTGRPKAPVVQDRASIAVGPELAQSVKVGTLATIEMAETLRIAGRLDVNADRTARIGAPVTGRITNIRAFIGKEVREGETLADLSSQDVTAAQLTLLKAHSAERLASRAVDRAELLLSADVIGSAELQRRQGDLTVALAEKRAAVDQLRLLGLSSRAIDALQGNGTLVTVAPVTSTQSGTVIERKVAVGQVVQPSDSLFVVSDLRSIWAFAEVPERQADRVRRGQRVEIEIPAVGSERRAGQIVFVADVVNPETRTVRVGLSLDNPKRLLKPAMLMTMLIEGTVARRTVVPSGAVVREQDADHVFLQVSPGVMKLARVKLGPERDGNRALLETLPANQGVVLEGAFHLNNERQKRNSEKSA